MINTATKVVFKIAHRKMGKARARTASKYVILVWRAKKYLRVELSKTFKFCFRSFEPPTPKGRGKVLAISRMDYSDHQQEYGSQTLQRMIPS